MRTVTLTLPECPSANRYFRILRNHAVKTPAARDYLVLAKKAFMEQVKPAVRQFLPMTGEVAVAIGWHRAKKMGDLDNRAKVIIDAICAPREANGVCGAPIIQNDHLIVELHMYRFESPKDGYMTIEVSEVG